MRSASRCSTTSATRGRSGCWSPPRRSTLRSWPGWRSGRSELLRDKLASPRLADLVLADRPDLDLDPAVGGAAGVGVVARHRHGLAESLAADPGRAHAPGGQL